MKNFFKYAFVIFSIAISISSLGTAQSQPAKRNLLSHFSEEDIAKALKISQPSVHQRLQAAGAQVFTSIIQRFESTVTSL